MHRERLADPKSSLSTELDDLVRLLAVLYFLLLIVSRFLESHIIVVDFWVALHSPKAFFVFDSACHNTVRSRYKRIVYKRIWVASLPFQSI